MLTCMATRVQIKAYAFRKQLGLRKKPKHHGGLVSSLSAETVGKIPFLLEGEGDTKMFMKDEDVCVYES